MKRNSVIAVAIGTIVTAAVAHAELPTKQAAGAAQKPSIVLVHGAFVEGSSWDKVVEGLQAKGYNVITVHEPLTSLADDVAATNRAIEMVPGDVTLVGHSYAGAVITEAGNNPKVKSLVYVAAFVPDAGESINDLGKGQPPPAWQAALKIDSGGFGWLPPETVRKDCAQDLPAKQVNVFAAKQGPINMKSFDSKVTTAAWKTKPSFYVRTEMDRMIDPKAQTQMAARAKAKVTSVKSSHVPMVSQPDKVVNVILAASAPTSQPSAAL